MPNVTRVQTMPQAKTTSPRRVLRLPRVAHVPDRRRNSTPPQSLTKANHAGYAIGTRA